MIIITRKFSGCRKNSGIYNILFLQMYMNWLLILRKTIKSFINFIRSGLNSDDTRVKIDLAETLALSLEFKMAGEILKTVVSHTIEELSILGAEIVLRALLTFQIHWELKMERQTEHAEREHAKIQEKTK